MEVAAAGFQQPVLFRESLKVGRLLSVISGIAALHPAQAVRHAVLYKLAQLRVVLLVLERVCQHRDSARAAYRLHRHFYRDDRARQIVLLSLLNIALERIVHALGKPKLIEHPRKVRPAYGFAEARPHLVIVKGQAVRRHELRHLAVPVVAVVYHPVQHRA